MRVITGVYTQCSTWNTMQIKMYVHLGLCVTYGHAFGAWGNYKSLITLRVDCV